MRRTLLVVVSVLLFQAVEEQRSAAAPEQAVPAGAAEEPDAEAKEHVVTAAIVLLGLIAFAGLVLLALVIFWGYRTRRIARTPLPRATQPDPFWYLRPDKSAPPTDEQQGSP